MRKVITETTLYTFDELSDEAKERAREWFREGNLTDTWHVDTLLDNTVTDAAEMLGLRFVKRGAYPAIDWNTNPVEAAFNGSWYASRVAADKLKADFTQDKELHRIADALASVAREFPHASADCSIGRSNSQRVAVDCDDEAATTEGMDAAHESITEAIESFAHWIACTVDREIDYQNSDEVTDENIRANEYEFTESGEAA